MKKIVFVSMLVLGTLGLSGVAQAQTANTVGANSEQVCSEFTATTSIAERFFGRCQIVQGVSLTSSQWQQLRAEGILVTSTFRMERIEREAARHGWRSDQVRRAMDAVSAEGNTITVYELDAEGLRRVQNIKGIDIAQNAFRITAWSMANDSDGVPMVDQFVFNENWQSIFAKTAAMALGNTVTGVVTSAANAGFQDLFRTNCSGGSCGKGAVINVTASATGGSAAAGSSSNSAANLTTTGSGCGTTPCGNGQILNPNPH